MNYVNATQPPAIVITAELPGGQELHPYIEVEAIVTAYTSAADECGKSDGKTASGVIASRGTAAVPAEIPLGSTIFIDDMPLRAEDHGGAIVIDQFGLYHIDIWMPTKEDARKWGRQRKTVRIYIGGKK